MKHLCIGPFAVSRLSITFDILKQEGNKMTKKLVSMFVVLFGLLALFGSFSSVSASSTSETILNDDFGVKVSKLADFCSYVIPMSEDYSGEWVAYPIADCDGANNAVPESGKRGDNGEKKDYLPEEEDDDTVIDDPVDPEDGDDPVDPDDGGDDPVDPDDGGDDPVDPEDECEYANPGNHKCVGRAGEEPNDNHDWGDGDKGLSDDPDDQGNGKEKKDKDDKKPGAGVLEGFALVGAAGIGKKSGKMFTATPPKARFQPKPVQAPTNNFRVLRGSDGITRVWVDGRPMNYKFWRQARYRDNRCRAAQSYDRYAD